MIRLAVIDAKDLRWQELTPRLREVKLGASPAHADLHTIDGAVFFGPPRSDIERFLRAGKHVLVSADAGWSKEMLQSLAEIAKKANARFTVANPERFLPSRRLIRQQLDAGKLGEPGLIRLHRWAPAEHDGSALRDLDLVMWYFGKPPNLVYAVQQVFHLGFPGGGMALLDHAVMAPSPDRAATPAAGDRYDSLSVICSSGAAYADDHQNTQLIFRGGSTAAIRTDGRIQQWSALVQEFVDSIVGQDSDPVMKTTGLESYPTWPQVLTVSEAVHQSLRTKQAVVPEGAP
jgi:predicted dehydrogenase